MNRSQAPLPSARSKAQAGMKTAHPPRDARSRERAGAAPRVLRVHVATAESVAIGAPIIAAPLGGDGAGITRPLDRARGAIVVVAVRVTEARERSIDLLFDPLLRSADLAF